MQAGRAINVNHDTGFSSTEIASGQHFNRSFYKLETVSDVEPVFWGTR
jgi:hypothetical protein